MYHSLEFIIILFPIWIFGKLIRFEIDFQRKFIFTHTEAAASEKRNVGSLKNARMHAVTKVKRDVNYDSMPDEAEIVAPVFQTEPLNYEELYETMNELYPNYDSLNIGDIQNEKRFLGEFY